MTRKLASIQKIEEIRPIEGADAIEHYRVLGWWVVDKKGAHQVGDKVIYVSIDSFIPHDLAPFLSKGQEPKEYEGVKGNRLRTVQLRGALSQGLLLPVSAVQQDGVGGQQYPFIEGSDVTDLLGIIKWEPQLPAQLVGKVRGVFPE
jgi:RNA ligase (TIGR02306 family)